MCIHIMKGKTMRPKSITILMISISCLMQICGCTSSANMVPPNNIQTFDENAIGEWVNVKATGGTTKLTISQKEDGWFIHGWGACSPTDCDWGEVPLLLVAEACSDNVFTRGFAIWNPGFSMDYMTLQIRDNHLFVEEVIVFTDNSKRSHFYSAEEFRRSDSGKGKQRDPKITAMVERIKKELLTEEHQGEGALIYQVRSTDGLLSDARMELHWTGMGRGGYRPSSCSEGDIEVLYDRDQQPVELRVTDAKYNEFRRPFLFRKGQVVIWDDIVIERLDENTDCTIRGVIRLEDNANPSGIKVSRWGGGPSTVTNDKGEFTLTNMPAGENSIHADKPNYHGLYTRVTVNKGQTATCEIEGYRIRKADVRWAYQPDGSRIFSNKEVLAGNATLADNQLDRVSFGNGFTQILGRSDFMIFQEDKEIAIYNCDVGPYGPAFQEERSVTFDALTEAPLEGYVQQKKILNKGSIFVFRTTTVRLS